MTRVVSRTGTGPRATWRSSLNHSEAFQRARELCNQALSPLPDGLPADAVAALDDDVLRPALELQIAGLNLLDGQPTDGVLKRPVAFACFAVDHLLWGWNLSVMGQLRVAFTLSRAAIEAAIFEAAAAVDPSGFERNWNTPKGTGGFFLGRLGKLPPRVQALLQVAWRHTAGFAHPSIWPVLSPVERVDSMDGISHVMTFAGQHVGSLPTDRLRHLARVYAIAAICGVEAMNIAIVPNLPMTVAWLERYGALQRRLHSPQELPEYLRESLASELQGYGG